MTQEIIPYRRFRLLLILSLLAISVTCVRAQKQFALSNNLVHSAVLTPNLRFEARTDTAWSFALSFGYRPWPCNDERARKYRHFNLEFRARRWANDSTQTWTGWYYGYDARWIHYNLSNIHLHYFGMFGDARHYRMQGNLLGLGTFGGYSWSLGRHWTVETEAGLDLAYLHYRLYDKPHCGCLIRRENKIYLMPNISVNLAWHFNFCGCDKPPYAKRRYW